MTLPREIGGFAVEAELGRGAMGVVYRARDPRLNRPVALKVILGNATPTALQRFHAEASAAAQLDHPNVVRVLSAGEAHGQPFLALEFVEGETLSQRLKRGGRLQPRVAASLLAQLARGVAHAHERGVIHRDIKPDNVLLAGDVPRLTDFGLARLGERDHTQTGAVLGTPAYMSPEQAAGETSRVGPPSDVYALGALLYTLLAGQPPFSGSSTLNVLRKILEDSPRQLPQVPRALQSILDRTFEKEPEQRTLTAAAMAQELDAWAHAGSRRAWSPAPRSTAGPRWPLVLSACSLVLAAGVLAWTQLGGGGPQTPDAPAPDPNAEAQQIATKTLELLAKVAAARDVRDWGAVERLLEQAPREPSGTLSPELAFEWACLQVSLNRPERALKALPALTERAEGALLARVHALEGLAHARRMHWAESAKALSKARRLAPDDWRVLSLGARAALERFNLGRDVTAKDEVVALAKRAVATGLAPPDTHALLAREHGVTDAAEREWILTLYRDTPGILARQYAAASYAYAQPQDLATALRLAEENAALAPRDAEAAQFAGGLYAGFLQCYGSQADRAAEKVARADELFRRARELAGNNAQVLVDQAYALRLVGEYFLATEGPNSPAARTQFTAAHSRLKQTFEHFPGLYRALREEADLLQYLEGPEAALRALDRLLQLYDRDGDLHYARYRVLHRLGRTGEALEAIDTAAELLPHVRNAARRYRAQLGR